MSDQSKISWGGQSWSPALKRRVGFIEQDDVTFPHLTVRQALMFAARLRLAGSTEYREQRVDQLLKEMHLEGCSNVLIGGGLVRGISGGQRKRVCIATELISKPKFLFCDEPTSGLVRPILCCSLNDSEMHLLAGVRESPSHPRFCLSHRILRRHW